jgi:AraC family transcriptional regulator
MAAVNPSSAPADGNVILRAALAGDYHVPGFVTPLSLKTAPRGVAHYATRRSRYRLGPASVLVLNAGQTYSMDLDAGDRTGTLCFFFAPGFVGNVARAMRSSPLDEPDRNDAEFSTFERVHGKSPVLAARLDAIEARLARGDRGDVWLDDVMLAIAEELVVLDTGARRELPSFPGLRPATRDEAYRRLHHARDFIDAAFAEPLTIDVLARIACMSAFHFQRLFKQAFRETPMQRVQRLRLDHAALALATSDLPVTRVCGDVGFDSPGSFSTLFKRRFGVSPRGFRQKRRIEEVRRRRRT